VILYIYSDTLYKNYNMKSPICEICLKSGLLCTACQNKVTNGELTDSDVSILTLLYKECSKNGDLDSIGIKKLISSKDVELIVCSKGDGKKIVGKGGYLAKKIQDILKKPVRIVEESSNPREFLQNIILPVPIINLNIIYSPKGEKYKIVIPRNSRLPLKLDVFNRLAKELLGKEVEIGFE